MNSSRLLWSSLAALTLVAGVALAEDAPKGLTLGSVAPMRDTKLKSVDGKDVSLASVAGKKGTLVVFTCNHCPWAKAWQARIATIGNAALAKGVGVVAINSNDPAAYAEDSYEEMQARSKMLGLKFPYAVDATSDLARAFGATHTPEAYLFDAKGKLVYHGGIDDNRDEPAVKIHWLQDAVDAASAGKTIATAETKAFGCSIKYREKTSS